MTAEKRHHPAQAFEGSTDYRTPPRSTLVLVQVFIECTFQAVLFRLHRHIEQLRAEGHRRNNVRIKVRIQGIRSGLSCTQVDTRHSRQGTETAQRRAALCRLRRQRHGRGIFLGNAEGHHQPHQYGHAAALQHQLPVRPHPGGQFQQINLLLLRLRRGRFLYCIGFHFVSPWLQVISSGWLSWPPSYRWKRPKWSARQSRQCSCPCAPSCWAQ